MNLKKDILYYAPRNQKGEGKMPIGKLLFFVALSLITGFIWGRLFATDSIQHYSDPEIPVGQFDEMVSVDVIKNGDNIWIVNHYSGHLIFEYNRFKEADKEAFKEYEDLLFECSGD